MMKAISIWLAATPASNFVSGHAWITPAVQSFHILSIAGLTGAALMIDARLLGLTAAGQPLTDIDRRFGPWLWYSALLLLVSGSVLIIGEPDRELLNIVFRVKMLLVIVFLGLAWLLQRRIRADGELSPRTARAFAFGSIALWFTIVTAGRWIAYV